MLSYRRSEVLRRVGVIFGVDCVVTVSGVVEGTGSTSIILKPDASPHAHMHFLSLEMFWETDEEVNEEDLRGLRGFVANGFGLSEEDQRPSAEVLQRVVELIDHLLSDGDNRN